MGCDIHQYTERLENGVWVAEKAHTFSIEKDTDEDAHEGYPDMQESGKSNRDYFLFGLLSDGVRYECPYAFSPKGEPTDASAEVTAMFKQMDGDGHGHNYLTFQEIREKLAELTIRSDADSREWGISLASWMESMGPSDADPEHRRVVFWFDN